MSRFFSGATHRIVVDTAHPTGDISVDAWVYRTGSGGANFGRIIRAPNGIGVLYSDAAVDTIQFEANGWTTNPGLWTWVAPVPSLNVWWHVVITYDPATSGTGAVPLCYVNGSLVTLNTTIATPLGTWSPSGTWAIGAYDTTASINRHWDGRIADVRTWSSVLTAAQAASLYRGALAYLPAQWFRLIGTSSPEPDHVSGALGTVTGATQAAHHRSFTVPRSPYRQDPRSVVSGWYNRRRILAPGRRSA